MAKELPYFKFEPNQWENGNIQICSREDKGLFLDLCSMYWSRLGDVPFKLALQKLCGGNATALDSLIEEGIFAVQDDFIRIDFLNEQLEDFNNISKTNSDNAREGWAKRRKNKVLEGKNATASKPQSESDGIREEERREEESNKDSFSFSKSLKNEGVESQIVSEYLQVRRNKKAVNTKTAFNALMSKIKKTKYSVPQAIKICVENSWIGFSADWVKDTEEKKYNPNTADVVTIKTWGK